VNETRRIFLRNYSVEASIGIHPGEKEARQRLLINVDLFLNSAAVSDDEIGQVLDYDFLRSGISALVRARHYNLQETLCQDIVALCLEQPQVKSVRVSTEKPDIYPDCDGVGCEISVDKG
jgi:dihydroneopterin aldolase